MKKILIAQEVNEILQRQNSFLNREDMRVFTAASNDEVLELHRAEHADLIITQLDMPGMSTEQFCSVIRDDANLGKVAIIMICANSKSAREKSLRCGANAVYRRPIKPTLLLKKAMQLLAISWRETYRVLMSVSVEGNASDQLFFCRTLDISISGMLIETAQAFKQGGRLVCSFFLPDADTTQIQVTGEIARIIPSAPGSDANRYGVHFSNLSPEAMQALKAFLDSVKLKADPRVS